MDDGAAAITRHLMDLKDLRAAALRRHGMVRGSPEWVAAIQVEDALIERIRRWVAPIPVKGRR
jgi:hypothetical protein